MRRADTRFSLGALTQFKEAVIARDSKRKSLDQPIYAFQNLGLYLTVF